ncbi:MAG: adenylosuccinate lyase, partial [Deltaproteobacteria bacterium]|nr:adenylosuccinate lyase [Deltaproteobacteria bacterium]
MIDRYSRKIMQDIWSAENRYRTWLDIEIAACEALCELGDVPQKAVDTIKEKADF